MKNGFVVPPRRPRHKIHHTTQMDFLSYCQLRSFLAHHHQHSKYAVNQHDNDKVTYRSGYHVYAQLKHATETNLRLISSLISLLYTENVISKRSEIKLVKEVLKYGKKV